MEEGEESEGSGGGGPGGGGGGGGEATGNFLAILRGVPALVYTFHRIYFSSGSLAIEIFGT